MKVVSQSCSVTKSLPPWHSYLPTSIQPNLTQAYILSSHLLRGTKASSNIDPKLHHHEAPSPPRDHRRPLRNLGPGPTGRVSAHHVLRLRSNEFQALVSIPRHQQPLLDRADLGNACNLVARSDTHKSHHSRQQTFHYKNFHSKHHLDRQSLDVLVS
jgi:hypothetical protein